MRPMSPRRALAAISLLFVAACTAAPAWVTYASADGRYSASFPGPPTHSAAPATGNASAIGSAAVDEWASSGNSIFQVVYVDFAGGSPWTDPRYAFDHAQANEVARFKDYPLASASDSTVDGYPGRALVFKSDQATITEQFCLVGHRLNKWLALSRQPADETKFVDSFRITSP